MRVVLGADVVIGALDASDSHHRRARTLFRRWQQQEASRLLSVVNLTEVLVAPSADRRGDRVLRQRVLRAAEREGLVSA